MDLKDYQKYIKTKRTGFFESPFDLVYRVFVEQGYAHREPSFFFNNASSVVESLRQLCWEYYVPLEKRFTTSMLSGLISESDIEGKSQRTP